MQTARSLVALLPLLFAVSAYGNSTKTTDESRSVRSDGVYYLIPEEEDADREKTPSGDTNTVAAKGESSTAAIPDERSLAAPGGPGDPGGPGGGGGGGGGGSTSDPLHETYFRQNIREDLTPYGVDLLGESFDLGTGSLSFNHLDVSIPGNNGLEVAIRRTVNTAQGRVRADSLFGDWELDVPKLEMMVSSETPGPDWKNDRCTGASDPGDIYYFGNWYFNYEYWNGLKMYIPGQGTQTVLDYPQDPKQSNTKKTTTDYWVISCTNVGGSEGFIATSPDGIKYHFNHLRYMPAIGILKDFKVMGRERAQMMATKVEDRFGNYVNYNYSGDRLTSITSSDGRTITLGYNSNDLITSVTANGRTWTYSYTLSYSAYYLATVTRPDGRSWSINIMPLIQAEQEDGLVLRCGLRETATGTITHPFGTVGTYTLTETGHGRTDVPQQSKINSGCIEPYHIQRSFDVFSLTQKKLQGPGLPTMTWNYIYSENAGGWAGDGTNPLKTTRVNKPDGTYDIHYFDRSWSYLEGTLRKVRVYSSSGALLQTVDYKYSNAPNRGFVGELFYENLAKSSTPKIQTRVKTTRGADVYTTEFAYNTVKTSSLFSFGKPIEIEQYNNVNGFSTIEDIAYLHDHTHWELARETTRVIGSETVSENVYDANNRVRFVKRFGQEVVEYAYNSNGTLAWQENALNHRVTTSSWKRGIPRLVTYPDSTTHAFVVDNNGWIRKSTDARGYATDYSYDNMGRMTRTEYPTNDGIQRLDKVITYGNVTSGDLAIPGAGLVSGQFKQVKTRGDFRQTTYFDAMLRPVLARTQDTGDSGLDRWVRQAFDSGNRPTFKSFPSTTAYASSGTNTTFDALGRMLSSTESVSPYASTSYTYLSGNKVRVANPRGKQTTTTYFALGSPDQSTPTLIQQPGNVTTTIARNVFAEMLSVTQSGTSPTISVTRNYRYDAQHRLCRQFDPETGSTVYSYDAAGRMNWYALAASGSTSSCDRSAVPSSQRIVHSYNNLGQLTQVNYPDASPDLSYTYDAVGNALTMNSSHAAWTYTYNAVNALSSEQLSTGGQTFNLIYGFDTQDRLTSITYPSGQAVSVTPNAYGETEVVSGYASNIDYHANGSIKSLTYGNGRVYSTTQNARQLSYDLKVISGGSTVAHLRHVYDANANVTAITDYVTSSANRSMSYDDLDRLATANGIWGSGSYAYDAIGNIRSKTEGGSTRTYTYNASNRLSNVSGAGLGSLSYDARGNVTNFRGHGYTYNLAGNLTSSTNPSVSYKYDGHKRRVQKTEGGQTTFSVYSSAGTLMHKKVGGVSTDYLYAGSMLVAEKTGSVVDYMHTDLLGSPIKGTNGSSYTEYYTPWGEKWSNPVQLSNDVGFTGHQSEIATGLTYMQARYYDPVIGRFLATDPVQFVASTPASFNRYTYVRNSPMTNIDPDGEWGIAGAIFGAISGAVGGIITASSAGGDLVDVAKGAVAGAVAGGVVGFAMPSASTNAGMMAAAAVTGYTSSIAGQAAGNIISGEDATENMSHTAALGSAVGGGATTLVAKTAGRWLPATGGKVIGKALEAGSTNASRAVGSTAASVIEGAGAGAGEAIASELLDDKNKEEELAQ